MFCLGCLHNAISRALTYEITINGNLPSASHVVNELVRTVNGGYPIYGRAIGILMSDASFPRVPGDVGNATTFDFPVAYKIVKGATGKRMVEEADPKLLEPFIEAAQELEREGVKAITTTCGFLAMFQKELASAVGVPVFTSSLMQVPLVYSMLKKDKKVGIITIRKANLTRRHFEAIGIESIPTVVYGMDNAKEFQSRIHGQASPSIKNATMDLDRTESEIFEVSKTMVKENPDLGAIVLECHNMGPYGSIVQKATGLPVFDITTLINYVYNAVIRGAFTGWL